MSSTSAAGEIHPDEAGELDDACLRLNLDGRAHEDSRKAYLELRRAMPRHFFRPPSQTGMGHLGRAGAALAVVAAVDRQAQWNRVKLVQVLQELSITYADGSFSSVLFLSLSFYLPVSVSLSLSL